MDYKKIFPIREYYSKFIIPIDSGRFRLSSGGKMVCPMHKDHDPSMGVIENTTGEVCHCFGCGYSADVLKLHRDIVRRYKHRRLSDEEVKKDLCRIFGIDYSALLRKEKSIEKTRDEKRIDMMENKKKEFDISDFRYAVMQGKKEGKGIGYFNALMMSMVWELNQK